MNYYKIPAEQLEQNLNDVLKMTGDTFSQHDAKLPVSRLLPSDEEITNAANNHQLGGELKHYRPINELKYKLSASVE